MGSEFPNSLGGRKHNQLRNSATQSGHPSAAPEKRLFLEIRPRFLPWGVIKILRYDVLSQVLHAAVTVSIIERERSECQPLFNATTFPTALKRMT